MSALIPFSFDDHPVRVHLDHDGDAWWEAQDVCVILGITDVSKAVARLKTGEKRTSESRNVLIINESGLYRLIFRSNKSEAQRFQDWVFGEVLPTIRKTGTYVAGSVLDHHPDLKAITELVVGLAEARDVATQAQATAHQAQLVAARAEGMATQAETKADMALATVTRMTVEHFILANGLLAKFPYQEHKRIGCWLADWCFDQAKEVLKEPVYDKPWSFENAYPLHAFSAWLRYEQRRPHAQTLQVVPPLGWSRRRKKNQSGGSV